MAHSILTGNKNQIMSYNNEFIQEIEVLKEIYMEEMIISDSNNINLIFHVSPSTGDNIGEKWVCLDLSITPGIDYPSTLPKIDILKPRGLSEKHLAQLAAHLDELAILNIGGPMIYQLVEAAKDSLTKQNIPYIQCMICLEYLDEQSSANESNITNHVDRKSSSQFFKTSCFHYFHENCFRKYYTHCIMRSETENEKNKENELLCPVCRNLIENNVKDELIDLNQIVLDDSRKDDDNFIFEPSSELRSLQRRMKRLYAKQQEKGGIINLEEEKNKFLMPENFVYTVENKQSLNESKDQQKSTFRNKNSHDQSKKLNYQNMHSFRRSNKNSFTSSNGEYYNEGQNYLDYRNPCNNNNIGNKLSNDIEKDYIKDENLKKYENEHQKNNNILNKLDDKSYKTNFNKYFNKKTTYNRKYDQGQRNLINNSSKSEERTSSLLNGKNYEEHYCTKSSSLGHRKELPNQNADRNNNKDGYDNENNIRNTNDTVIDANISQLNSFDNKNETNGKTTKVISINSDLFASNGEMLNYKRMNKCNNLSSLENIDPPGNKINFNIYDHCSDKIKSEENYKENHNIINNQNDNGDIKIFKNEQTNYNNEKYNNNKNARFYNNSHELSSDKIYNNNNKSIYSNNYENKGYNNSDQQKYKKDYINEKNTGNYIYNNKQNNEVHKNNNFETNDKSRRNVERSEEYRTSNHITEYNKNYHVQKFNNSGYYYYNRQDNNKQFNQNKGLDPLKKLPSDNNDQENQSLKQNNNNNNMYIKENSQLKIRGYIEDK